MSDELAVFFNKKKDKKKKAVKVDDVASLLERKSRKQEENEDHEEVENEREHHEETNERSQAEDSEWLEYDSHNIHRLEGLKIKDMAQQNRTDEAEEEDEETSEEKKQAQPEPVKTWGSVEKKETAPELIPSAAEYAAAKPIRYVPPSQRGWNVSGGTPTPAAKIDINNQEMFPTFAAANEIEKHKKDEEKKSTWSTVGGKESSPAASAPSGIYRPPRTMEPTASAWGGAGGRSNRDREEALASVRAMAETANSQPAPFRPPIPTQVKAVNVELRKSEKPAYVPPHLRDKTN